MDRFTELVESYQSAGMDIEDAAEEARIVLTCEDEGCDK